MPIKTLFILITLLSIFTAIIANEESLIIETENQTIEAIIKADENIGTRSNKSLDKEKILAVLCVVTNFILENNKPLTVSTLPATATVTEGEVFTVPTVTAKGDSPEIVYTLGGVPTQAGATFDTLTVGEYELVVVVTESGGDKETANQVQTITVEEKEVVDQPTVFNVTYTASTHPRHGDLVTPAGTITSPDQKIEWIEVNGRRLDPADMTDDYTYTFSGSSVFSGTTLSVDVKTEGNPVVENHSA